MCDARGLTLLLTDSDVDTNRAFVFGLVLLVQNSVDGDGRLARTAVTDDELALAATDWNHRVNRFDAGLQRDGNSLAVDDACGLSLDRHHGRLLERAFAVGRFAEGIDHAPEHLLACRHGENAAGGFDRHALTHARCLAENGSTDAVFFEVQNEAVEFALCLHRVLELLAFALLEHNNLAHHSLGESVYRDDAVADGNDLAHMRAFV